MSPKPTASISKLSFSGGNSFQLDKNEKIILVGPNNSGKSQSLREIISICQNGNNERTVVVTGLEVTKVGNVDDLKQFLKRKAI